MKKIFVVAFSLCASAFAGISIAGNRSNVAKADGDYKLLFAAHDFSSNADVVGYNNGESSLKNPNYQNGVTTFSFTSSQTYSIYKESFVETSYMAMTAGKTYRYSLTYKTTGSLQVHIWCNNWNLIDDYAFSQDWTTVTYDITPSSSSSFEYAFQAPDGLTGDLLIKNVYFGELKSFSNGDKVGTLPAIPEIEGYNSTWTIDGQEITSESILDYSEDKIALAKYESTASSYKVCFVEHDLVEDYSSRPLDSTDCMARKIENNQLVLTGQTADYYFSKNYTFEAGKTYYVSGAYKNDEFSSFSLYLENPWTDIFVGKDSWNGYTDFYFEFCPSETTSSRFGVQCAWCGEGSSAGQSDVSQYMRNFFCGEVKTFTKNVAMGDLPNYPTKTGYTCEGWTINDQLIDSETIYNFGQDTYAYPSFVESGYKIGFAEVDYGDQPQQTNGNDLEYSLENGILHMVSSKREGPALWINPIDVIQGHNYIVSLTFKKDHNDTSLLFREDNIVETLVTCASTEYQTTIFELKAEKSFFHFYFQFAWWTEGATSASGDVISLYIADLNDGMAIMQGDEYGTLPSPSDKTITHYSWSIDGNIIFEDGTFDFEENKIAILVPAISFDVDFVINNEVVETKSYYTGDAIGEFPEYTAIDGYEYKWVIGDDSTVVNEYSVLNYETKQTITLVKTAITYYATFIADDVEVAKVGFTVETTSIEEPDVPSKEGYTGAWETYSLGTENITINAVYSPVTHFVTFMADGKEVAKVGYVPGDGQIEEPNVPNKEGYTGAWEAYELTGEDIVVNAVYTAKQYLLYFRVSSDSDPIYLVRVTYGEKISKVLNALPEIPKVEGKIGKWVIGDNEITLDTVWNIASDSNATVLYEDDPNYRPQSKGCGGAIVANSTLVFVSVISLLIVLGIKKKHE